MIARRFEELTTAELYSILCARADVFTREEKILYPDADGQDTEAVHVFHSDGNGKVQAYLRMFPKNDRSVQMGRILTTVRGEGLGKKLIEFAQVYAKEHMCAKELYLESQMHAVGFYEKCGFSVTSAPFMEAGIEHVKMEKKI